MTNDAAKYLARAERSKKENKKFLQTIQRHKDLDKLFHNAHDEVFAKTDCLTCANCCKTTSPIFRDVDIERIAKHMRIKPSALTTALLHIDDENDWVLNQSPCTFLQDDNLCSIYEVRPLACREYPHTHRKNMAQITDLTWRNTTVCPAVAEMVERIKTSVQQT
ncbi:MAG: YkgJ family cysteine cluster protein [Flavobacteriales bacterium]